MFIYFAKEKLKHPEPHVQTEKFYLRSSPAKLQTLQYLSTYFIVVVFLLWTNDQFALSTIMEQKHISKQFREWTGSPRRLQMYWWFTRILLAIQVHRLLSPKKANAGWIFHYKEEKLAARLPASTKRSLSLASLADSCSCCNLAMLHIQSVS